MSLAIRVIGLQDPSGEPGPKGDTGADDLKGYKGDPPWDRYGS